MTGRLRQSVGIMDFIASLGGAAIVSWVVIELASPQISRNGANATNSLVQQSNTWMATVVEYLPVVFLFIAAVGALAFVVFETQFV